MNNPVLLTCCVSSLRCIINTGVLKKLKGDTWNLSSSQSKPHLISVGFKHFVRLLAILLIGITKASILLALEFKGGAAIKVLSYLYSDRRRRKESRGVWSGRAW
jgi:hypothetical protein